MRLRLGLVLALTLGLTPGWAAADRAPASRADARAELRERLADRLDVLDPQFAKANETFDYATVMRGADFDKDGVEEVIDIRVHVNENDDTGEWVETMRLDVRRGRDGKQLWSKTVGSSSYVFPVVTKVGSDGAMGIVVVEYGVKAVDAAVAAFGVEDTTVTSFDGKGTQLWTASYNGASAYSDAGGGAPTYVEGFLDANQGGGTEVLVSTTPFGYAYDPQYLTESATSTIVPVILDGATGQARPLTPVPTTSPVVYANPVPDLNKDGREDVLVTGTTGATTTAVALRSSDGAALWTRPDLPAARYSIGFDAGDVTADGVADVSVSLSDRGPGPLVHDQDAKVALVNGATGTVVWTKNGSRAMKIGNADRKPGGEVVVGEWLDSDFDTMGFRLAAYNGAGTSLWSVTRSVTMPIKTGGGGVFMVSGSWGEIGDTGSDGVAEVGFSLRMEGSAFADESGTVDGRTGKVRRDPAPGMYVTRLTFDGRGTDAYRIEMKKNVVHVTAYRGSDNRKLWHTTFATKGFAGTVGTPVFAGRDKCGDLAIRVGEGEKTTHVVLSGATGKPLWAVSRSGQAAGKVTKPAVRSNKAFVRAC